MKKAIGLIGLGLVNLLHASLHIIQFIQSLLLMKVARFGPHIEDQNTMEKIIHSPVLSIVWGLVGLFTLYIGIKDFIHHRSCNK